MLPGMAPGGSRGNLAVLAKDGRVGNVDSRPLLRQAVQNYKYVNEYV